MANDKTTTVNTPEPAAGTGGSAINVGDEINDQVFDEMLDILNDLTSHTHIFYDDYSTACNCNCNCTCCVRGMVW